ncbi:hypothetical protein F4774DRAFT_382022 [Daldinia eschscholtzii]|nr:hypothetical protein F4774DRAFT_382022 [Daldinia eschscholtzii]
MPGEEEKKYSRTDLITLKLSPLLLLLLLHVYIRRYNIFRESTTHQLPVSSQLMFFFLFLITSYFTQTEA